MAGAAAAFAFNLDEPQFFHRYRLNELSDGYLFRTTRLTRPVIGDLLTLLRPILQHPTNRCDAVAADTQLIVALTFYASGGFQWASAMAGHTSQSTTCRIIRAVTDALCDIAPQFIRFPMTVAEQTHTKHQFYRINHFPNVLGAIDGTHINIKRPPGEHPEQYVNRHGRFSMNVMAVCDANLKFLNVYADYPGSNGDGYIWAASELGAAFRNGAIVDGWLLGDSAYPLQPWLMTPLQNPNTDAEHGYNRAHKKTRSTIERSFGLLKSRFRCLDDSGGDLCYSPLRVCKITKACCVLHNICCDARIEMVVDEGVALRVAAMANGPPRAIQRAGAGMAVQRRLIDNHQWLPPQNV